MVPTKCKKFLVATCQEQSATITPFTTSKSVDYLQQQSKTVNPIIHRELTQRNALRANERKGTEQLHNISHLK
jgi:hypothetical protein